MAESIFFIHALEANLQPTTWLIENKKQLNALLLEKGGVVLRGFMISSVSEFNRFANMLCPNMLDYIYRSTPRTRVGGKIYTTTEYPAELTIPLHNENAYSLSWPKKILFYCAIPPQSGGETPIADSRRILENIPRDIVERFEQRRLMYVRNYYESVDLPWQEVFQTEERREVEAYCSANEIEWEWPEAGPVLRTKQKCQATLIHPSTGQKVWFNQAHLFHHSSLDSSSQQHFISEFGYENLPRNVFFADGSEIDVADLDVIRCVFEKERQQFSWQYGDIMILDNCLMAHGRAPYSGKRKILAAME